MSEQSGNSSGGNGQRVSEERRESLPYKIARRIVHGLNLKEGHGIVRAREILTAAMYELRDAQWQELNEIFDSNHNGRPAGEILLAVMGNTPIERNMRAEQLVVMTAAAVVTETVCFLVDRRGSRRRGGGATSGNGVPHVDAPATSAQPVAAADAE